MIDLPEGWRSVYEWAGVRPPDDPVGSGEGPTGMPADSDTPLTGQDSFARERFEDKVAVYKAEMFEARMDLLADELRTLSDMTGRSVESADKELREIAAQVEAARQILEALDVDESND